MSYLSVSCGISGLFHGAIDRLNRLTVYAVFLGFILVISDSMPHISYVTLMHGFLSFSFLTMCATVVVNLAVGALDRRGKSEIGDRVDHRCRWLFPLAYFGLNFVMIGVTFLFF